jgi:hypothetical protein
MNATDAAEVLGLQSEYLSRQMLALSTQVRDLGQSAAKIVVDAAKPKSRTQRPLNLYKIQ